MFCVQGVAYEMTTGIFNRVHVITKLLLNEIYHLWEFAFDWLILKCWFKFLFDDLMLHHVAINLSQTSSGFKLAWAIALVFEANQVKKCACVPEFRYINHSGALSGLKQFLATKSLLKMINNAFRFILKSVFRFKGIRIFVLNFWSCRKTAWLES